MSPSGPSSSDNAEIDDLLPPGDQPRRGFLIQASSIAIGGLVGLVPAAVGLATFLNPLRKSVQQQQAPSGSDPEGFFRIASLDGLSAKPQLFKLIADRKDAWNTFPREPIGAVYLQKAEDGQVRAFNAECPHAGCLVDFRGERFHCPCHNSSFAESGERDPMSPSARDLDALEVKTVDGEVLVKFQKFRAGTAGKHPS